MSGGLSSGRAPTPTSTTPVDSGLERERDRLEWLQDGESGEFAGYLRMLEASLRSLDGGVQTEGADH